jgi:hypothetical protein
VQIDEVFGIALADFAPNVGPLPRSTHGQCRGTTMPIPNSQALPPVALAAPTNRRRRAAGQREDLPANGLAGPVQHLLHEADAARYVGISVAFLRQARVRAKGPAYFRIGRSVRYRVSDLEAWLSDRRVTTRDQTV